MVLLLNYLNPLIMAVTIFLFYKSWSTWKKEKLWATTQIGRDNATDKFVGRMWKIAIVAAVLMFAVKLMPSSYGYKGGVERLPVPTFEKRDDLVVQDRLRKPAKADEEAKRDFDKMVDWRNDGTKKE